MLNYSTLNRKKLVFSVPTVYCVKMEEFQFTLLLHTLYSNNHFPKERTATVQSSMYI